MVPAGIIVSIRATFCCTPLIWLMALAGAVVVLGYLTDALYVSLLQRAGQTLIADMRNIVYQRSLRLPRSYFDTHPIG